MQFVLASASPARLSVLRAAGLEPEVEVSDVDEDALLAGLPGASAAEAVTALAGAKATAVARRVADRLPDAVVVGCDSMLHIGGALVGKPGDAATARARWQEMAGRAGELVTGHAVLRLVDGEIDRVAEGHAVTTVRFARPDPAELEAYLGDRRTAGRRRSVHPRRARRLVRRGHRRRPVQRHRDQPAADPAAARRGRGAGHRLVDLNLSVGEVNLVVMALPNDPAPKLAAYAHPERLVTTAWLAEHLGEPGLVVVESDEDVLLYDVGHIPGAVKVDWHTELNDPVTRDYVDGPGFARLCGERGITRETTVVFYGDRNNWWATYALWVFSLFGHPDVRILDGGRAKWIAEGRELTTETPKPEPVDYPVVDRDDETIRAFKDDVLAHLGRAVGRRALARRVLRRAAAHAGLPAGGRGPRRPHPGRGEHPVGPRRGGRRHVQDPPRAGGDLPGGAAALAVGRRGRLLPHRRALQPHLVRAHAPARVREGAQLRRQLDGVGQLRPRADRAGQRAGIGPAR